MVKLANSTTLGGGGGGGGDGNSVDRAFERVCLRDD